MNEQVTNEIVVVGSVAIDWVITPKAERKESVGGSATYFSMAASKFAPVSVVGIVGKDFPEDAVQDMKTAGVGLEGLEVEQEGLTFRWKGKYHENMNDRDTLETHLNCFEHFAPKLPADYRTASHLFLANIQPQLQMQVLDQMERRPTVVGLDTMNLWIDIAADELRAVLKKVDILTVNDEEARQITGIDNIAKAAQEIRKMGPKTVVIKRGEYGALLFGPTDDHIFSAPGLPLFEVRDPTGAGDTFAGGFMGQLTKLGEPSPRNLRASMIWGSVMASFLVEDFSYDRVRDISEADISERYEQFVRLTHFPSGM